MERLLQGGTRLRHAIGSGQYDKTYGGGKDMDTPMHEKREGRRMERREKMTGKEDMMKAYG
jgi:hypothetical protein